MDQRLRIKILRSFARVKRGNKQILFCLLKGRHENLFQSLACLQQPPISFGLNHLTIDSDFVIFLKNLFPENKDVEQLLTRVEVLKLLYPMFLYYKKCLDGEQKDAENDEEKICIYGDNAYPRKLEVFSHAPLALYVGGEQAFKCWQHPLCITIVGSRQPTSYGLAVTEDIVRFCCQYGLPVLSGMAQGIDRQVHEVSCRLNHPNLAVLGNGIDICYPRQNQKIYDWLRQNGLLVSEQPFGTRPRKEYFPARNRILSGLAHAVVVVEAAQKSGSLITATHALEQGKEIYAVPGNIYAKTSCGTNQLIRDGAQLYTDAEHFLYSLEDAFTRYSIQRNAVGKIDKQSQNNDFDHDETRIIRCLQMSPLSLQEIFQQLDMNLNHLLEKITSLEAKGYLHSHLGLYDLSETGLRSLAK